MNKKDFRVAVVGGRDYADYRQMCSILDSFINIHKDTKNVILISGGAKGADALAERYAEETKLPIEIFPAEWNRYGKAAGAIRNREMAKHADRVIAFWDGKSKGTANMIMESDKRGVISYVVDYAGQTGP